MRQVSTGLQILEVDRDEMQNACTMDRLALLLHVFFITLANLQVAQLGIFHPLHLR